MKWGPSLLLLTLLLLPIFFLPTNGLIARFGWGGGASYSTYSQTIIVQPSSTQLVQQNEAGSTWLNLPWFNPSCVSVVNTNELQVLPNSEYLYNNATFTTNNANIAINVTIEVGSSGNGYPYGGFAIGYGVNYPGGFMGNYEPALPYGNAGIVVVLEHGAMADYHLFLFYDGQLWGNWSVGTFNVGQKIGLGFLYIPPNTVKVFWYNGTVYTYTVNPVVVTSTGIKAESLTTLTSSFIVGASNGGPTFGYGQWIVVNYQYDTSQTIPPYAVTLSWTAVTLGNGVKAVYAFTDADNPVNVSTNATSWSVIQIEKLQNFSVTGSQYSLSGSVTYTSAPKGIYLVTNVYPSGNLNGWYINVTIEFQFVTPQQTVYKNITIPVFVSAFAESVSITPPQSSYLSGQTISVTNTTTPNYPSNLGYEVISPPKAEIDIEGLTNGFVPLPYTITETVSVITTYNYIINVVEGGLTLGSLTGSITIYPVSQLPVIFVSQYPTTVTAGTKVTITFQFSLNTPVSNVTVSAFTHSTTTFAFSYVSLVSSSSLVEFNGYWLSANDGFIIVTKSSNYLIPFNGSAGIDFANDSVNTLQIEVNGVGQLVVSNNQGQVIEIANSTPVIGLGFYYGAGKLTLNWFFVDGIILQSATANQAYTILTGTSLNTLTQYTNGYTNASGFGQVTVTLTYTPYELVEIYWGGLQKYVILNISVTQPTTTTTTTVNTSTLNYNYTNPFTNNISPTSTLYNFSNMQPWAELVGIVIVVVVTLLGWKFGGKGGASGGVVMGLIAVSYLGLVPWYIFYIFIFGIALLLAKIFVDRFMGGEEE
ncbi:hypothetical protein [Sulfolobus spindle-shaped virus]|nr:hypothetical protein [Sulfolobus spindle-shaped virus]AZG04026.1 hypothetical protein [Sulfolobus spindle-shaped virus]